MEGQIVWVPDSSEGYCLGRIIDIKAAVISVQLLHKSHVVVDVPYDAVFASDDDHKKDVHDSCSLMYLNEASLLHNMRLRYNKDQIYTYVANILLAVNPYKELKNLYSSSTIANYQGKSLGVLPPHVFAIADKAFRDMRLLKTSQSIIISGESGAGKTESTKYVLRYLCESWGTQAGAVEKRILDANPVLEAFGNAKTMRNNNSSRFGKFIEIHFDNKFSVVGGYINYYLLEKSRICFQNNEERNYHIFYQLCAGATPSLKEKLKLSSPENYQYINKCCNQNSAHSRESQEGHFVSYLQNDVNNFNAVNKAFISMGLTESEIVDIYTIVAAVLHLGNVTFDDNLDDNKGGCRITSDSDKTLSTVASLLGVDAMFLKQSLLSRVMQPSKGGAKGTIYMVPLKVHEAQNAKDALSKALYSHLFDYLVQRINKSIPFSKSAYYIGVLDIAGFEYLKVNSFEQFCINYCNEKLQHFFNERILKDEQELYRKEGLKVSKIEYIDNQDCIELLESKCNGIFDVLDEENKLPKPSHTHFTSVVHKNHKGHFRLDIPRSSKLKDHREIRDDEGFLIRHFAGAVCYSTAEFIEKNNDALHASLETVMLESQNVFVKNLFKSTTPVQQVRGKLNFISVSSKFRVQLNELMTKLSNTGTHFIRCLKPNFKMADHCFEGNQILMQLRCSGMTTVLKLMQQGYPSRCQFGKLYDMYKSYIPVKLSQLDPRFFCKALCRALGLRDLDFFLGITKVFFKTGKFAEFDQVMKSDPNNLALLVKKVERWLITMRWKKVIWCALSVIKLKNKIIYRRQKILLLQRNIRMCLAKCKFRPRYVGIRKLKELRCRLNDMIVLVHELKVNKAVMIRRFESLQEEITQEVDRLKDIHSAPWDYKDTFSSLVAAVDEYFLQIQQEMEKQKARENEEEIQALHAQILREKAREREIELAEEQQRLASEDIKKRKLFIEHQRVTECNNVNEQLQASTMVTRTDNSENDWEALTREFHIQQEYTDHELALRLAQDFDGSVDDVTSPPSLLRSSYIIQQQRQQAVKKYDLSKWKYSDLRDTINTSCDLELLDACREEFHRRLKVYHSWKSKNLKKGSSLKEFERAPESVLHSVQTGSKQQTVQSSHPRDRFFRIAFFRPCSMQRGWWYAHFDGDWICRQMELYPDKSPILLTAGTDDLQMCELSLQETGLSKKRGAEILKEEFDCEWLKNGGKPWSYKTQDI